MLDHMGSKSWVGDSLRPGTSLEELEQAGVRVDEEGEDAQLILRQKCSYSWFCG